MGIKEKPATPSAIQNQLRVSTEQPAFVVDDLNDLAVKILVRLFFSPAGACEPIRRGADGVLRCRGGRGAVRGLAVLILQVQGR